MIKIVVDLKGADNSQDILLPGAFEALEHNQDLFLSLCGDKEIIMKYKDINRYINRFEIIDCEDEVTNFDNPVNVFRQKPNSSLIKGLLTAKEADGFVSCGSTGAVLVSSILILGKIKGLRPALASVLNGYKNHKVCIMDCGANIDCKVEHLYDFGIMGSTFMETIGISNPKVGLLSNGAEDKKGNALVKEAHTLLKESKINFIGNIEGKEALSSMADVIVCDGFDGNILLKTIEGTAKEVCNEFYELLLQSNALNTDELDQVYHEVLKKYDYNTQGGAILLGVNKPVIKGHGSANSETMCSIINMAYNLAKNNLIDKYNQLLK